MAANADLFPRCIETLGNLSTSGPAKPTNRVSESSGRPEPRMATHSVLCSPFARRARPCNPAGSGDTHLAHHCLHKKAAPHRRQPRNLLNPGPPWAIRQASSSSPPASRISSPRRVSSTSSHSSRRATSAHLSLCGHSCPRTCSPGPSSPPRTYNGRAPRTRATRPRTARCSLLW